MKFAQTESRTRSSVCSKFLIFFALTIAVNRVKFTKYNLPTWTHFTFFCVEKSWVYFYVKFYIKSKFFLVWQEMLNKYWSKNHLFQSYRRTSIIRFYHKCFKLLSYISIRYNVFEYYNMGSLETAVYVHS